MRFEEAKVTKQQPLPFKVDKGPEKIIPEKQKSGEEYDDSGSNSDSSDDEVTFLKKLVSANAFT